MNGADLSSFSMHDLFRLEAENQVAVLTEGLLSLERHPTDATRLEELMRAAHSLKGAARIVGLNEAVQVTHSMEDCFVAAQAGRFVLGRRQVDQLLRGVDLLTRLGNTPEAELSRWKGAGAAEINGFVQSLATVLHEPEPDHDVEAVNAPTEETLAPSRASGEDGDLRVPLATAGEGQPEPAQPVLPSGPVNGAQESPSSLAPPPTRPESTLATRQAGAISLPPPAALSAPKENQERVLRVTAESLNRLLGLAGETLVESRWLSPHAAELLRLRRRQGELVRMLEDLRSSLAASGGNERVRVQAEEAYHEAVGCHETLTTHHEDLEVFLRRSTNLSRRLYREAQLSRMRPFADRIHGFPRFVRDMAASLGKEARLDFVGANTQVDRDILEKLEAPLTHLLRNALDHGLESPEERRRAGKEPEGRLTLEARHSAGLLMVILTDDGRGIEPEILREAVVRKGLSTREIAARMNEEELVEFLFLPGFSTRDKVTEISGRGVGLDVVRSMVHEVRGTVRLTSQPGRGTRCVLMLPLTLSVLRALLVEIGGELYALPLARIVRTVKVPRGEVRTLEGREHFLLGGQSLGLVPAHQVLELPPSKTTAEALPTVVLGDQHGQRYGLVVDQFHGEHELVVQTLDPRLGKVKNVSAGAILADRAPVLIVDVDDLLRSVEILVSRRRPDPLRLAEEPEAAASPTDQRRRRVLVVDDSLTVRELERKLLAGRGYAVDVAVDGMDGWNTLRSQDYDLVISDVDMPRLDGIGLIGLLKKDARLRSIPVMIVSYKDREEDRRRGLEAGADYYLTKSSFHDESLLEAVADLIGGPEA